MSDDKAGQIGWEKACKLVIARCEFGLERIARRPKASRLRNRRDDDPSTMRFQPVGGLESFFELIGADRDELECRSIRVAVDMSRTYVDEALGRLGVETVRHVALGHDKASYLAAPAIDRPQRRGSAVRIDGKQHAGRIRHLAQQGLANRRILV